MAARKPSGTRSHSFKNKNLKDYLDAKKKPTRLIGDVERWLLTQPKEDRDYTVLHPSDLVKDDYCVREGFYLVRGVPRRESKPNLRLQNIFDEGHEIHAKWQKRFEGMGVLWGMWDNGPGTPTWFGLPSDGPSENRRYREVPVKNAEYNIRGHGDGLIIGIGDPAWLEVKSMSAGTIRKEAPSLFREDQDDKTAWTNVTRPFPSHLRQTMLYLFLASICTPYEVNEGVLIYEWKADQSVKEFVVQRNDELIYPFLEKAVTVMDAVDVEKVPDCNVKDGGCSKCKPYEEEEED